MSLLEPEFAPHYAAWKADPSKGNTGRFLAALSPVLDSALKTYSGGASPTLRSKAKLLALHASTFYDPTRAKLRTHLMTHLQGLRRLSAREGQIISLPERVGLDLHHLYTSENELQDRLGRPPSTLELSDHTGLSLRRIAHIRKSRGSIAQGSMRSTNEEGGEEAFSPAVVSADDEHWTNFVLGDLHPIDQQIAEHTLGLHGQPVLQKKDIARKLGLSRGAISQRAARIQQLLDKRENAGGGLL